MEYVFVLVVGLGAGTLGGVIGTGSSIVLMPVLVILFGPRQAVPIMAIAALMGNAGRVIAWWREIAWRACAAYCATAVPAAALGAGLLLTIPPGAAELALGVFFLGLIPLRRWLARRAFTLAHTQLALLGTEAAASIGMYGSKVATFQALGALPGSVLLDGLIVGSSLMAGSFIGRAIVLALTPGTYRALVDALMLCSGLTLLWAALR